MMALRPMHFLALRLGDPLLHEGVRQLQAEIITREPSLAQCTVPPERSHLTCLVFQASSDEDLQVARETLAACTPLVAAEFGGEPPTVTVKGLGRFGQNVLFAELEAGAEKDRLCRFVEDVRMRFAERNLLAGTNGETWTPHVTLLKTSRASNWRRGKGGGGNGGSKRLAIRPAAHEGLVADLGAHALHALELCAMAGSDPDGFYPVLDALPFAALQAPEGAPARSEEEEAPGAEPFAPCATSLPQPNVNKGGIRHNDSTAGAAVVTARERL